MATITKSKEDIEDIIREALLLILEIPKSDNSTVRFVYNNIENEAGESKITVSFYDRWQMIKGL